MKAYIHKKTCTVVFLAVLLMIAKPGNSHMSINGTTLIILPKHLWGWDEVSNFEKALDPLSCCQMTKASYTNEKTKEKTSPLPHEINKTQTKENSKGIYCLTLISKINKALSLFC